MILARTKISQRRHFTFSSADGNGSEVFATDFLRAVLAYSHAEAVHVFADIYESFERTDEHRDVKDLRREFPRCPTEVTRAIDLPALASRHEYVFGTAGVELQPLAEMRLGAGAHFPINSTLSALDSSFLLPLYLGAMLLCKSYDAVVVPSRAAVDTVKRLTACADELLEMRSGRRIGVPFRLVEIPHGVDDALFADIDRAAARRLVGVPADAPVALYLGRLSEHAKADLEPLLVAFRHVVATMPNAVLVIAGHDIDKYSEIAAKRAQEQSIREKLVFVLDFPHCFKPFLYAAADVFVSPVDNIQETFGLSIVEAMAAGLPVIASDWSGYRNLVVHGKTGLLIPTLWDPSRAAAVSKVSATLNPRIRRHLLAETTVVDVKVLAEHLVTLLGNVDRRRSMGQAGRKRALVNFQWRTIIQTYEQLWKAQLEEARREASGQPIRFHDLNGVFGHYASKMISPEMIVAVSERGRDLLEQSATAAVANLRTSAFEAFRRFAQRFNGQPVVLRTACAADGPSLSQIVNWVKRGYLDVVSS